MMKNLIIDEIKGNLIEYYENLLSVGVLMAVNKLERIDSASEAELLEILENHTTLKEKNNQNI